MHPVPAQPPIFTLPSELLQQIIIASAAGSPPSTVAAITQTCKLLYSLVYNPTDHHLWREIFITFFDDPRPALKHLAALYGQQPAFDWEEELKSRMRAAQVVRRSHQSFRTIPSALHRPATRSVTAQILLKRSSDIQMTLRALLSVLVTSFPFPPTTTIAFGPLPSPSPGLPPKYPAFPPLVLLLSSSFCTASSKSHVLRTLSSASSQWLEDVLSHGFPRVLTRRLLADPSLLEDDDMNAGGGPSAAAVEQEFKEWGNSEEAKLFYKLVAHTGFIPASASTQDADASQRRAGFDDGASNVQASDASFTPTTSPPSVPDLALPQVTPPTRRKDPFEDAQFASARRMARRTVYDLRFLRPERMFGPFMPQHADETMYGQEGFSQNPRPRGEIDDESDDSDDVPVGTNSDSDSNMENEGTTGEYDLFPLINLITPQDMDAAPASDQLPSPETLMPDWTWLAGARIIVEANLRDMLRRSPNVDLGPEGAEAGMEEIADALRRLEGLRMGGAPGFWDDGWMVWENAPDYGDSNVDKKGKGRSSESMYKDVEGVGQGWDWAGVTGTWR